MNINELKQQINRVIGVKGDLRIQAWWMNKILNDILVYCDERDNSKDISDVKTFFLNELKNLETTIWNTIDKSEKDLNEKINNSENALTEKINNSENALTKKIKLLESKELFKVVDSLPDVGENNIIYLTINGNYESKNILSEYIYINESWEKFGDATIKTPDWNASTYKEGHIKNRTHHMQDYMCHYFKGSPIKISKPSGVGYVLLTYDTDLADKFIRIEISAGESKTHEFLDAMGMPLIFTWDAGNSTINVESFMGAVETYGMRAYYSSSAKSYDEYFVKLDKGFLPEGAMSQRSMVSITYAELVTLRDNGELIAGMQYRITDYVTTTTQENTQSAGHQFDVIVTADNENTLNEVARACLHEVDTYFSEAGAKLGAWQIWYSLDNDSERFAWADAENGKGVIYRMIDEFNNECPYDFKNIQFARWELSNPVGYRNDYFENNEDNWIQEESTPFDSLKTGFYGLDGSGNAFTYVYNEDEGYYKYKVEYTISESPTYCYTFGKGADYSMNGNNNNYGNVIKEYKSNNKIQLNNIVFLGSGSGCHDNSFGTGCYNNSFGDRCFSNSFGDSCYNNSFGDSCYSNSYGNGCYSNSFGNDCSSNSFGNDCYRNSFGNDCYRNSFGEECSFNFFGTKCSFNFFGESSSNLKSYYRYIIFDNGNSYINLNCTSTTSSSKYYQNVRIGLGVNNTTTYKTISDSNVGQTYQTLYTPENSQTIKI